MNWYKNIDFTIVNDAIKSSKVKIAIASLGALYGVFLISKTYKTYKRNAKRKAYPKDVVILHQMRRGLRAPSVSPFAIKLETWLRMAKIPYQNEFSIQFSSKGLFPWITINDVDIADSQFCIEYLSQKYGIDFDKNLTDEQKAISKAVLKLAEESLRWIIVLHRFVFHPDVSESGLPKYILKIYYWIMKERTYAQGYGRHTVEEAYKIGKDDLKAINDFIGNKTFLLGDEPTANDPAIFGTVVQILCHDRGPLNEYLLNNCPNILRYIENIKAAFWLDWNENIEEKV